MRADSPPPWNGPMEVVSEREGKGGREGYERVEMEVPASPEVKDAGRVGGKGGGGEGGFVKAELSTSDTGEKREREMGVELP